MKLLLDTHLLLWAASEPRKLSHLARELILNHLPPLHKDPFDRLLVAQAIAEGFILLTTDDIVAQYPVAVKKV